MNVAPSKQNETGLSKCNERNESPNKRNETSLSECNERNESTIVKQSRQTLSSFTHCKNPICTQKGWPKVSTFVRGTKPRTFGHPCSLCSRLDRRINGLAGRWSRLFDGQLLSFHLVVDLLMSQLHLGLSLPLVYDSLSHRSLCSLL